MSVIKIIILGLGNPILGDDGVGWRVVDEFRRCLLLTSRHKSIIDMDTLAVGGLSLMEYLIDYDKAILIDAIQTGSKEIGEVFSFLLEELLGTYNGHTGSVHDTNLFDAIQMGRKMGLKLPNQIIIVGIETKNIYNFSEQLSPSIEKAIPIASRLVLELIQNLEVES
jgi:hydrogenase maturation protease